MIKRIYTERQASNAALVADLKETLGITAKARMFIRYDVEGLTDEQFDAAVPVVFSTPATDEVYLEKLPKTEGTVFAIEYLPGQFDQRADSASSCVQLLLKCDRPVVRCAVVYAVVATEKEIEAIEKYLVNPVESRLAAIEKPTTLEQKIAPPEPVRMVDGFTQKPYAVLNAFYKEQGFAMSLDDLIFVQSYFRAQRREPTYTELKVIDTYWSDHCRHTTFLTALKTKIKSDNPHIEKAYADYTDMFNLMYEGRDDKYPSLMDVATIGAKVLRKNGYAAAQDISPEINACTIKQDVVMKDGSVEPWYILFKNETHNHPTEIEPFGGAATCLGGAIRDPLSGRAYVYQAMRITGAADINAPFDKTLEGKLPQRVISKRAASGYSSYGNQIGLATGEVREYYHSGYAAKRLETGFVVGAAPECNVVREVPVAGDIVVLIGGETGRDGCGGATGSSKPHDAHSIETCGAEVQKGNAPIERKLQRLMKNGEFTRLIKRCNDFGAGGVAVAVGELAPGLDIELGSVPKKYAGLSATELAISESQERMAVVIAADNLDAFTELCHSENVDATVIAKVTDTDRMRMYLNGNLIVDLERRFLDSNGVRQEASALIKDPKVTYFGSLSSKRASMYNKADYTGLLSDILSDYNVCSQKGLGEMFDSTIGASSVFMPFGGKYQLTPTEVMAAKLPANTDFCTVCSHGLSAVLPESPFMGGLYSVILAVEKLAAAGVRLENIYLTMQEFFARCTDAEKWGAPMSALLGALTAQMKLRRAAIGGKDSMSGTFEKISVPPTLIAFACGVTDSATVIDNTFKQKGERVYRYKLKRDAFGMPDFTNLNDFLMLLAGEIGRQNVTSAAVVERGGAAATVVKSCFGNGLGFAFASAARDLFEESEGDIIFTARTGDDFFGYDLEFLGVTTNDGKFLFGANITTTADDTDLVYDGKAADSAKLLASYTGTFENVYPTTAQASGTVFDVSYNGKGEKRQKAKQTKSAKSKKIKVFIPVFPGTNCEIDTARKFELAGAQPEIFVVKNRNPKEVEECVKAMAKAIEKCKILALPGGFSGGDEPDGSAKLIAAFLSNPAIAEAVEKLLYVRDGLAIGICNGFQALVKLGLLPSGHIHTPQKSDPVLTFNDIGRHVSTMADIRVCANYSPWLNHLNVGDVYQVPVSHGEGKFVADKAVIDKLVENGQIATQYCDMNGNATMQSPFNPNGSTLAIEGITSPDGRVFGKMGHSERTGEFLLKNVAECYAKTDMGLFKAGVKYFK
ncbi:MAG: phosphoribosylformylglycinamidine synthase [Clostridiales bacterium]|nr:phosphoribosylformylglycinamidine synthase [Clostridiales bacterium]